AETIRSELDLEIIAPSSHTRQQRTAPLLSSSAGTTVASVFLRADWYENSSLRGSGMTTDRSTVLSSLADSEGDDALFALLALQRVAGLIHQLRNIDIA